MERAKWRTLKFSSKPCIFSISTEDYTFNYYTMNLMKKKFTLIQMYPKFTCKQCIVECQKLSPKTKFKK